MSEDRIESILKEVVSRLVAEFQPEAILLYGSYAWGEPTPDSDLDLLVIVTSSDERPIRRMQRACGLMHDIGFPMDIMIQTREEFERFLPVKASLARKIAIDGKVVYGRPQNYFDKGLAV